jgi:hypothetical protein
MKKSLFIGIGFVIILIVAWYLISPLFNVKEVNDVSPIVDDAFDSMPPEIREEFDEAVNNSNNNQTEMEEEMPQSAFLVSEGEFKARAHEVSGKVLLIEVDGKHILRFEDFETVNGPNLHIYLASDLSENDFIDLGPIKATKGNVNYEIPEGTDLEKYNKVLVWCVPFKVLFSYADVS